MNKVVAAVKRRAKRKAADVDLFPTAELQPLLQESERKKNVYRSLEVSQDSLDP